MPQLIASRTNPRVKQLRAAFAGHARLADGLIAIEGETLLSEAIRSGLTLSTIFIAQGRAIPDWLPRSIEIIELTSDVFASAVDTQSPQGIAALLTPPARTLAAALSTASPLLLIAAGLQDPGNLGTLTRSAEAFGASAVLTTPGTVSEWNQKTIRASAGSIFRMPVIAVTHPEIASLKFRSIHLYAAVADNPTAPAIPIAQADLTQPCAVMIGNEGAGLSSELLALADTRITIPTPQNGTSRIESLNAAVAGSLILYEASRQRMALRTTNHR